MTPEIQYSKFVPYIIRMNFCSLQATIYHTKTTEYYIKRFLQYFNIMTIHAFNKEDEKINV